MARVEIPAPGDLIMDDAGNVRTGVAVSLTLTGTATNVTHYSALTGGTSTTGGLVTGSDGTIVDGSGNRRYVDSGVKMDLTIAGRTRLLNPLSAAVDTAVYLTDYLPAGFVSGSTDCTSAIAAWGVAAQAVGTAKGGVRLVAAPGVYNFTSVASTSLVTLQNLSGVKFSCEGATFADQFNYTGGNFAQLFRLNACNNISGRLQVTGERHQDTGTDGGGLPGGLRAFYLTQGCRGIDLDLDMTGGRDGVALVKAAADPASYVSGDGKLTIRTTDVFYPYSGQYSGDNMDVKINAVRPGRVFTIYGCKNVKIQAQNKDQALESMITTWPGDSVGCTNIDVFFQDRESTVVGTAQVVLRWLGDTVPATHSRIKVGFDTYLPSGRSFIIDKRRDDMTTFDTTARGHVLDGLEIYGRMGYSVGTLLDHVSHGVAFGELVVGDTIKGLNIHDLVLTGAQGRLYFMAKSLVDRARVDHVTGEYNVFVENQGNGSVLHTSCKAAALSRDATDKHVYIDCESTGASHVTGPNQRYIGCKGTGMGALDTPVTESGAAGRLWLPGTAKMSNIDAAGSGLIDVAWLTSGTLMLAPGGLLRAGDTLAGLVWVSGGTPAGTPTNYWACLVRASDRKVKAISADKTTTAWAANTQVTFTFGTPYTPTEDERVQFGLMVAATTVPTVFGINTSNTVGALIARWGASTTGLTTPLALDTVVTAPAGGSKFGYAYAT